jgi:predicted Fe-S protein YdhL (DUF1289 family)
VGHRHGGWLADGKEEIMSESPCVGICIMEGDYCIGCGRTIDEIAQAGMDAMAREQEQAERLRPAPTPVPPDK